MIIVGGIIKNSDNKYLLIKERKEKYYGMYNIPAGHLEENELLIDGAKREIKEETGYTVDVKGIVQVGDTEAQDAHGTVRADIRIIHITIHYLTTTNIIAL